MRTDLVEATQGLLASEGPDALTSRAIADSAGANLASITYYFGSKEHLVAEAMISLARTLIEPVVDHLARRDVDAVENLLGATQLLYRILDEHRSQLPGYVHSLAAATASDEVRSDIQTLHRSLVTVLAESIADQQQAGLLPDWISAEPMSQLIVAVVNGIVIAATVDPDRTDEVAIGTQFAQLLLAARTPGR